MAGIGTQRIGGANLRDLEGGAAQPPRDNGARREQSLTWKAIVLTVVPVLGLLAFLWIALSVSDPGGEVPRERVADVTLELVGVHRAALQAGILQMRSDDPAVVRAWLAGNGSTLTGVPDLSAAGLTLRGARMMGMAGGDWSLLQYADRGGRLADLLVVVAPDEGVTLPAEAVAEVIDGRTVYLDRVHGIGVVYATLAGADWMLVSADDAAVLRGVFRALAERLG